MKGKCPIKKIKSKGIATSSKNTCPKPHGENINSEDDNDSEIPASSNIGQKDANDFRKKLHDTHPKVSSTVYDLEYTNTKAGPSNYMLRNEKRDINGCNISGQFRDKQLC